MKLHFLLNVLTPLFLLPVVVTAYVGLLPEPALAQANANIPRALAVAFNEQGQQLSAEGRYQEALDLFEQALSIVRGIGEHQGEAAILNNIGEVYIALDDYPQALDFFQRSLAISTELSNRLGESSILNNIGAVYDNLGQYEQALGYYQQALTIYLESGDRHGEAVALNNIGLVYKNLGQYEQALEYHQQALAIRTEIGDRSGVADSFNNIGGIYSNLGQYEQALDYYQRALVIYSELGYHVGEGAALNNIGLVYSELRQYERALEYYQQALAIRIEVGDRFGVGGSLLNIGGVYNVLGQYEQALEYHQRALATFTDLGASLGEGTTLNNIGLVYGNLGQYEQALALYQQALAIRSEIGDRFGEAVTLSNIGFVLEAMDELELAIAFFKQSVNQWQAIRGNIQGLDMEAQQAFTNRISGSYRRLADLLLESDRVLEAQEVLDLLKLQELEEFQLRDVEGTPETRQGLSFWQAEQEILERYDEFITQPDSDINGFIARSDIGDRITQLRRDARGQNLNPEQLVRLQRNLQQVGNAALLYPLILDDRLELVLVTTTELTRHTVAIDRPTLEAAIVNFRSAITNRRRNPEPQAQELYQWLMAPLIADLEAANATTILYAADGKLRYIPLAALHDGEQWLTQRYTINHITAASLMDFSQMETAELSILAGAFPEEAMEVNLGSETVWFNGLPFAQKEVENLANLIPNTTALFNEDFSRTAIESRLNDYTIIHLATHAEFRSGHPTDSYILLGDGDRITLFDLDQWELPNVDLVVLSACRTGISGEELGTGEEILGFGYQMQRTGARGAIASFWYVNDGGTQVLMNAFYTALHNGYSRAEALQRAQIALITNDDTVLAGERGVTVEFMNLHPGQSLSESHDLVHPYYWAPFILIGQGL